MKIIPFSIILFCFVQNGNAQSNFELSKSQPTIQSPVRLKIIIDNDIPVRFIKESALYQIHRFSNSERKLKAHWEWDSISKRYAYTWPETTVGQYRFEWTDVFDSLDVLEFELYRDSNFSIHNRYASLNYKSFSPEKVKMNKGFKLAFQSSGCFHQNETAVICTYMQDSI